MRRTASLAAALLASACASTAPGPAASDEARSADAFGRIAALAGSWKGEFSMGEEKGPAEVGYRLTGNGSAVEEVLFRGTPHEMITMYHRDGPRLLLTHYCAAGNQPTMVLAPGDDPAVLRFDFLRATNLSSPAASHMHEATMEFPEPGRVRASWVHYVDGKAAGTAVLDLRREK